jgi:hypothetical protein
MSYAVMFDFVLAVLTVATFGLYVWCWTTFGQDGKDDPMLPTSGVTKDAEPTKSRAKRALH